MLISYLVIRCRYTDCTQTSRQNIVCGKHDLTLTTLTRRDWSLYVLPLLLSLQVSFFSFLFMAADVQGGLIVVSISNKGNLIVFVAFHAPLAPVRMGLLSW